MAGSSEETYVGRYTSLLDHAVNLALGIGSAAREVDKGGASIGERTSRVVGGVSRIYQEALELRTVLGAEGQLVVRAGSDRVAISRLRFHLLLVALDVVRAVMEAGKNVGRIANGQAVSKILSVRSCLNVVSL